ncbi:MAG: hypothetical protein N3D12_04685 [Candidatus Methanomethyliaceae archaeon]|nr:hypothetical protein [Candidatus Methanomethyliaceae archaeon]
MSSSPALECLPLCEKSECYAFRAPDSALSDRIKFDTPTKHDPVELPTSLSSFANCDISTVLRDLLTKILPNTPLEESIERLKLASYIWFMYRAYDGIIKSDSKDLILPFEDTLSGNGAKHFERLENIINEIRNIDISNSTVEILANRTKAVFSLLMAIRVIEKS